MAVDAEKLSLILDVQATRFENALKRSNAQAYRLFKQLESRAEAMESPLAAR